MSRLLSRIMLAILMLPVASMAYVVVFGVLYTKVFRWQEERCFVLTGFLVALFTGVWWWLLWRRTVRWTARRLWLSAASLLAAPAAGLAVAAPTAVMERELGAFLFGPAMTFAWLIITVLVWSETGRERARRLAERGADVLVCPACGYNLTGLRQATCPECGATYTLQELVSSQPGREAAELDAAA